VDVSAEVMIAAGTETVARYAMDPANDRAWIGGIREVQKLTDGPLAVGSRVRRVASFLGRRIDYVLEVTQLDPGARLVLRSVKAPFPMSVTYEFEPDAAGTRARIRLGGDAGAMYRVAAPVLDRAARRGIGRDLRRLQQIMERAEADR
jgi:uncharacterized membrane protein